MHRNISLFLKVLLYLGFIIAVLFLIFVIVRIFYHLDHDKTTSFVQKIHSTKLTIDDVQGNHLPPDPGTETNQTVQGIDANQNGIRDDIELAIFKAYPDSPKIRAVLLQYAIVLQMQISVPLNEDTATDIAERDSQAYDCISTVVPHDAHDIENIKTYRSFVEDRQLNTESRINRQKEFYKYVRSYTLQSGCDIDVNALTN